MVRQVAASSFTKGFKDGLPICIGYFSVSVPYGVSAVAGGLPPWLPFAAGLTSYSGTGQIAGLPLLAAQASYVEMLVLQFLVSLRYFLMSVTLSQKLHPTVRFVDRLFIGFGNTDEIFAVATSKDGEVTATYMAGLILSPYIGWTLGALFGAVVGAILPQSLLSALGICLSGMFVAIIMPSVKKTRPALLVVTIAALISCVFYYMPFLQNIPTGIAVIAGTLVAAGVGAAFFPIPEGVG